MHDKIEKDFISLSTRAKIAVLARTIHMETIHNRDHAEGANKLYRSSEFMHRLAGFIMSLSYQPDDFQRDAAWATKALIEGVAFHGQPYLEEFHEWIAQARTMS